MLDFWNKRTPCLKWNHVFMLLQKLCCVVSTMICVRRRSVVKYFQGGEIVQLWWQWNVVTEGVTPSPLLEIIGQSLPEMLLDNLFFTWLHNKNSQILDFLENLFEPAQICPWEWLRIFRNFTWNDDVKSFFALWGRVEWAGAELNGIDTWECQILHPWTHNFSKI